MRRTLALLLIAAAVPVWAAQPVRARHGMVVTRERHATEAGLQVLQVRRQRRRRGGRGGACAGGDASRARATSAAAASCWCAWPTAAPRSSISASARRRPPRATCTWTPTAKPPQDSIIGYRASGVPGTVRGLEYANKKYGKKPWAELVHPAVELASQGLPALLRAGAIAARHQRGLARLSRNPSAFS